MYQFIMTPRWLSGTAVALLAIAVCLWLGSWQLGRFQERAATRHQTARAATAETVPLDRLLSEGRPKVATDTLGRTVTVTGSYDHARHPDQDPTAPDAPSERASRYL
jgi:cytochrome oxidase assembly protein ShyY1